MFPSTLFEGLRPFVQAFPTGVGEGMACPSRTCGDAPSCPDTAGNPPTDPRRRARTGETAARLTRTRQIAGGFARYDRSGLCPASRRRLYRPARRQRQLRLGDDGVHARSPSVPAGHALAQPGSQSQQARRGDVPQRRCSRDAVTAAVRPWRAGNPNLPASALGTSGAAGSQRGWRTNSASRRSAGDRAASPRHRGLCEPRTRRTRHG